MKNMEWTLSKVRKLTKNYSSRTEFQNDHYSAYWWAKKNRLLNEIFPHLPPQTLRGYWSKKENVLDEAKKYQSKTEFKESRRQAYNVALKNEWNEVFSLFSKKNKQKKWDNKVLVLAESKKYKTRQEFQKKARGAWRAAKKNMWDEAFDHMEDKIKPAGYWDKYDNCANKAHSCTSKMELRKIYRTCYEKIKNNGWNELLRHMVDPRVGRQPSNISEEAREKGWCLETIKPIALAYKSRSEFEKAKPSAYKEASKLEILDEVCSHMKPMGNHFKRAIYAIEFEDLSVYVGLTFNFRERLNQHKRNSSNKGVKTRIKDGVRYKFMEYMENLSPEDAQIREEEIAKQYIEKGFNLLNRAKLGRGASLGGGGKHLSETKNEDLHDIKWSKSKVLEVAKICNSRSEFKTNYSGAWRHASHHGYLEACQSLIQASKMPNGYWASIENVISAAKECSSRSEFKRKYSIAYRNARQKNLLDSLFPPPKN